VEIQAGTGGGIRRICKVLELPRSSYYQASEPTATELGDRALEPLVEEIFLESRRTYGYRRVHAEMVRRGVRCGLARVRRLMARQGLKAVQAKRFRPRTSDGRANAPNANLLKGESPPRRPDEVWVGDITFIPSRRGWLYLAVVMDLFTKEIVGWSLGDNMRSGLVIDAFRQAATTRRPGRGTVFHSDRGSQYGSSAYRGVLRRRGFRQSMSARANPYDNAAMESFMGTLKLEMLRGGRFENEQDARTEIFDYIHCFYNRTRLHSALGYLPPAEFKERTETTPA